MAIEKTYLLGKNITLGCGFDLQAKAPLDSRQVVPEYAGLQALIDGNAAYEGMIVYDEGTKKTYQAQLVEGVLAFREFGINEEELKALIASETTAAMEFKGAATALPENPSKGDFYKVTASFDVVEGETAKVGDSLVYDGEQWFIIPSGDDIEDTWRPVTDVNNDATLTFVAGDKLEKTVAADGTITYKHATVEAPELLAENEQTRTYITEVETDGFGHITGYKTATENVVDTNTTYEFEGQAEESSVYFTATSSEENADPVTVYLDTYSKNEADGKFVAKEGYIAYTQDEKDKLAGLSNYDDEEVRGLIGDNAKAIEDLEKYVGTIPTDEKYADITNVISYVNKKAEETLSAAQGGSSETAASVKQQLDNYKSENDTRVKAVEDAIDVINDEETGILKQAQNYADGLASNYDENGAAASVKTELTTEINKKVDKVEGKDLISTSEITRLASVANYDDTQVKADIAKKADAEAMTTELGKKVDKVDGKDLIATSEIERLATLKNYDDTALVGRMTTAEGKITALETESAKHALKTEVEAVDAKFASYNTTAVQKGIDDAQDARIKAIEDDYLVEADIADFETKANVKKVADDLAAYVESNDAALAAEVKARTDADTGFETRIAALEGNFGDGEGTVEAQIAAAVGAEKQRAEGIEGGLRTDVDAIKADYLKASDKEALQNQINTIMSNPDAEGAINSINEFTQYVKDHGTIAEGMRVDINKNKDDIAAINNTETGILKQAKDYADGLAGNYAEAEHKHVVADITDFDTKVKEYGYATTGEVATAKSEAITEAKTYAANQDAVVLAEAQGYTNTQISNFNTETVAPIAADVADLKANKAGYATTGEVATAKQEAIDAAKAYADGKEHKNTTYSVAATENALEFTVTPSEGAAQTVKLVAPVVDTGVMSVVAGNDIVVTPGENGSVTVAHEAFTTGSYAKNPNESDVTGDVYMMTSVTVDNGHVTGANVQSLAHALMGMTFIFDGGNSSNN